MATNSLIDKYNLLLKRGMPEHPSAIFCNGRPVALSDLDARHLIEGHAIEWLRGEWGGCVLHVPRACDLTYAVSDKTTDRHGEGPTLLAAIVAATAHLDGDGEVVK
jgi:hypothetical protein